MAGQKIATCCYCGTRAALVLTGRDRHELACSSCGAPLHEMKMIPSRKAKPAKRATAPAATPAHPASRRSRYDDRPRPKKRKKSLKRKILSEAFDLIEDIFD